MVVIVNESKNLASKDGFLLFIGIAGMDCLGLNHDEQGCRMQSKHV